ncbi:MAG TPA: hypothetical protein VF088_02925 [Pyrinomonadaceae bacterium]
MRRLTLAVVLACVLAGVAQAGEIPSTGATTPQPPGTASTTGEIPSTGATSSTLLTIILIISDTVR